MTSRHTLKSVKQACMVNPFFFCWLYLLKNRSAKVKCFLRFSIVRIWPKFKKNCQIFLFTWFKWVARNIDRCFTILLSHLACSQIWLHLPMDHCHFGYITKLTKNTVLWWKAFSNLAKFSKLAKNIQIGQKNKFSWFSSHQFPQLKNIYILPISLLVSSM